MVRKQAPKGKKHAQGGNCARKRNVTKKAPVAMKISSHAHEAFVACRGKFHGHAMKIAAQTPKARRAQRQNMNGKTGMEQLCHI